MCTVPSASHARRIVVAHRKLELRLHGGHRRFQLMRRIGNEPVLQRENAVDALEQCVDLLYERLHFAGNRTRFQRAAISVRALRDRLLEALERREPAHDAEPDDGARDQNEDDLRKYHA